MKALVYTGPKQMDFMEVDAPAPAAGHSIVDVSFCGICGSDMHAWAGHDQRRPAPLILGHEISGTVVEGSLSGRRVIVNPLVTCGNCAQCKAGRENLCPHREIISMAPREGGFAEQVAVPIENLSVVPDEVPLEIAALVEPLACGWHAVRIANRTLDRPIEDAICVVLGGGAIGLGAALVLASKNAGQIWLAETNPDRRAVIERMGDFKVFDPTSKNGPAEADLVIDGVGYEATRAFASEIAAPGGTIAHIGLGSAEGGLDIRRMTLQEITFVGTYTYNKNDFRDTAAAVFDGSLGALNWPEIRALGDGAQAFRDISQNNVPAPKIILNAL